MTSTSTDSHKVLACITGASGFVGPAIALRFLSLGHSVRLPLRKQEQANAWLAEYGSKYEGKIETILLSKGMEEDGAFDEAVKECEVVVHAASPANFHVPGDAETAYLKPAINGTLSILESAKKSETVKSFVYTTSVAAYTRIKDAMAAGPSFAVTEESWNSVTYEEAAKMDNTPETASEIYAASKAQAEKAAWAFVKQPGVKFTLSTIAPVFTLGYHSAPGIKALKDFKATPEIALEILWTKNAFPPADGVAFNPEVFVSINDIARAHVDAALHPFLSTNTRYLLCADRKSWRQLARAGEEEEPRMRFPIQADTVEKHFGWKYEPFKQYIGDFARQVVELADAGGEL